MVFDRQLAERSMEDAELFDFHESSAEDWFVSTMTAAVTWGRSEQSLDEEHLFDDDYGDDWSASSGLDDPEDVSHVKYPGVFRYIPPWEFAVKVTMYGLIILIALVGNAAVITVVARNKRMHTPTNFFIVNLAVSDILVTSMCTWVHLVHDVTEGWVLGAFFCKINSFAQVLSLVSSILTLTLIACDRFFGIVFAMKARVTERRSSLLIAGVWIGAVSLSSPLLVYREQSVRRWRDHTEIWCDDTWPPHQVVDSVTNQVFVTHPSRTIYYSFISAVLYFLPIAIMTIAYMLIIWKLWSSQRPGETLGSETRTHDRIKKRVVVMLVILLSVFAVCWLPFQITILYAEYRTNPSAELPEWHFKFTFFANFVAFSNSAFNPIIYTGFNENFRRGFRNMFFCCRKYPEIGISTVGGNGLNIEAGPVSTCSANLTSATGGTCCRPSPLGQHRSTSRNLNVLTAM